MTSPIAPSPLGSAPPALQNLSAEEKRRLLTELLQRKAAQPQRHQPSLAQERLWFLHQLDNQSAHYNMLIAWRLTGNLNVAALHQSLQEIVRRHAVLRTVFQADAAGMPLAVVAPTVEVQLTVEELPGLADSALEQLLTAEIDTSTRSVTSMEGMRSATVGFSALLLSLRRLNPSRSSL